MQPFPHHYEVGASADAEGPVVLSHRGVASLESLSPVEFGGPGGTWSPEALLVAAVADCFILTFRAVAKASQLEWASLGVEAEGTLERRERVTAFTAFRLRARLVVAAGVDADAARAALERAEHGCLVSNSLKAPVELEPEIAFAG